MPKMPTNMHRRGAEAAENLPQAEPVGNFAAAADAAKPAADAQPAAAKTPKRPFGFLPLFAAAFSGAVLALAASGALHYAGFGQPAPLSRAAPVGGGLALEDLAAAKTAFTVQAEAAFAQKAQQLNARLRQVEQNLADKAAQIAAQAQSQAQTAPADAAAKLNSFSRRLDEQAQQLAAEQAAVQALTAALNRQETRNREILAKTDALREEVAVLYDKRQRAQTQIAQLLALQNLQAAFDSGAPYQRQWQIFQAAFAADSQAGKDTALKALAAGFARYQQTGLPSSAALAQSFTLLADKLAAQSGQADAAAGFWRSIMSAAASRVRIRPQGAAAQGMAAPAILARMEAALAQGDSQAALDQAAKLPPQMQDAVQTYTAALRQRLAADRFFAHAARALFAPAAEAGAPPQDGQNTP